MVSLLPPVIGAALDMAYEKDAFIGRTFRVRGETGFDATSRESTREGVGAEEGGRIFLANMLRLFFPYRTAEKLKYAGEPQGDDTLLWDPRPTKYKGKEITASIEKNRKLEEGRAPSRRLLEELVPFLPQPSRDPQAAKGIRERRRERRGESTESPSGGGGSGIKLGGGDSSGSGIRLGGSSSGSGIRLGGS